MRTAGRPKSENPKDTQITVRVDADTLAKLDECVRITKSTRVAVIRNGIQLVYSGIKK